MDTDIKMENVVIVVLVVLLIVVLYNKSGDKCKYCKNCAKKCERAKALCDINCANCTDDCKNKEGFHLYGRRDAGSMHSEGNGATGGGH